MKLKDLKPTTAKFYIKHPVTLEPLKTDDGEDIYWEVVGKDSSNYLEGQKEFLKHLEELGDKSEELKSDDYKTWAIDNLARLVVGWDEKFNDFMDGPYSKEKVIEVLSDHDHQWLMTQLDAFVAQRKHFFVQ